MAKIHIPCPQSGEDIKSVSNNIQMFHTTQHTTYYKGINNYPGDNGYSMIILREEQHFKTFVNLHVDVILQNISK